MQKLKNTTIKKVIQGTHRNFLKRLHALNEDIKVSFKMIDSILEDLKKIK